MASEALGGQRRPVPVAARQAHSSDVQLSHHADRAGLQVRIENVDAGVGIGPADVNVVATHIAGDGANRCLGRPVFIEDANARAVLLQRFDLSRRERLAANDGRFDRTRVPGQSGQQRDVRGRQLDGARRLFAGEDFFDGLLCILLRNDANLSVEAEGRENRSQRQIEHRRRE